MDHVPAPAIHYINDIQGLKRTAEQQSGPSKMMKLVDDDDDAFAQFTAKKLKPKSNTDAFQKKKVVIAEKVERPALNLGERIETVYEMGKDVIPQLAPDFLFNQQEEKRKEEESHFVEELDEEVEDNEYNLPYTHEAIFRNHTKMVLGLAIDPVASKLITSGADSTVAFHDFNAMDPALKPFREIIPFENCGVHTMVFNSKGDRWLAAANHFQMKVYDRDSAELFTTPRGYPYIQDPAKTKGHVANVSAAIWSPTDESKFYTSALDSTVRLWDIESEKELTQKHVIKVRNKKNLNVNPVHSLTLGNNGTLLIAGCDDGTVQIWSTKNSSYLKPTYILHGHTPGTAITSVQMSTDDMTIASRSTDNSLCIWDIRNTKTVLKQFTDLPNHFAHTGLAFSPQDNMIVTGTSAVEGEAPGSLVFIEKNMLEVVKTLPLTQASVQPIIWHPTLNQIFAGCTDGSVHALFDPNLSQKGMLYAAKKAPKKRTLQFGTGEREIYSPHAIESIRSEDPSAWKIISNAKKKKYASLEPSSGGKGSGVPGSKGILGSSINSALMKPILERDNIKATKEVDAREAILKFAKEAEENPIYDRAYQGNKKILDYEGLEVLQKLKAEEAKKEAEKRAKMNK